MLRSRRNRPIAAVIVMMSVAGCGGASSRTTGAAAGAASGSSASASDANQNGNGSYLGEASNAVVFVQWTRSGSQISGTLYQALEQGGDNGGQVSVNPTNTGFSGTVNGQSVTISLDGGTNMTGTLKGSEFDLDYPGQDGGITAIQMHQATSADYNHALAALNGQAGRSNTATNASQAGQAVADEINALEQAAAGAGTGSVDDALAAARRDLGTTLDEERHVLAEAGDSSLPAGQCGADAGAVGADAGSVGADQGAVQAAAPSAGAGAIRDAINKLEQGASTLDGFRGRDQSLVPASAPSDADVSAAIASGRDKLHRITAAVNHALAQAQQMVNTANDYADKAQKACP